eukprot:CAMPEP_0168514434 /NCGR_PEP_ID=MMETSP0405-20121227/4106_1 /TAXON_ID=498012 /ORGANISM="Trichosphaerium sp, Strain Am-I-7 wt" /LENGTH=478 /DNA_ID=CAMNT_0008533557 /DNA_START=153 /DNA_END=1589 /DNA_ORIENTATION=-
MTSELAAMNTSPSSFEATDDTILTIPPVPNANQSLTNQKTPPKIATQKLVELTPQAYLPPKAIQNRNKSNRTDNKKKISDGDAMDVDSSATSQTPIKEETPHIDAMVTDATELNGGAEDGTVEDQLVDIMGDDKSAVEVKQESVNIDELKQRRDALLARKQSILRELADSEAIELSHKRKRGRPRKLHGDDSPVTDLSVSPPSYKRRKRGRPKKGDPYDSGYYQDTLIGDSADSSSGKPRKRPRCTWSLEESKFLLSLFERGMTDPHELFEEFQKLSQNSKTFEHVKNKKCNLFAKASQRRVSVIEVLREDIKKLGRPRRRSGTGENGGGDYSPPAFAPPTDDEYIVATADNKKSKRNVTNIYRKRYYDGDVDGAIEEAMQEIRAVITDKFHEIHQIMVQQKTIMSMMVHELRDINKRMHPRRGDASLSNVPVTQAQEVVAVGSENGKTSEVTKDTPVTSGAPLAEAQPKEDVTSVKE